MTFYERITEVLEHYDYAIVVINKYDYDNVISLDFKTTPQVLKRDLTIVYGAERVSNTKQGIKVTR